MQKKRARERIIMFLCIISLLFTPVLAASQSNAMRVSLDLKSATVKEFFDAVKVQTGLNFIYSTEQVKNMPRITIQSNSQPISEVLNKVLANTGYSYEIEGNIVTIVYQQPKENVRTATGVVVDEGGLPLPGAYIKLSKTEHSTITDNEGKFSINLFHQKAVSYTHLFVLGDIGGIYLNERYDGDQRPSFKTVSKQQQKKALNFLLNELKDLSDVYKRQGIYGCNCTIL